MIEVLGFDVFGTVVDWRSGITRDATAFLAEIGSTDIDPARFADGWRARYQPAMEECRSARRPYVRLDTLHREMLDDLLARHDITGIDDARLDDLAHAWRRLDPWPDAIAGLARLKARYPIVTLSNANVALALAMARHGGLPWDAILGAEATRTYKPSPQAYLGTADILGIAPASLCLVAAHHSDLAAARRCGLATAYVDRPLEYGGRIAPDADAAQDWDWSAGSLEELADALGC